MNLASEETAAPAEFAPEEFGSCTVSLGLPRFLTREQHRIHLVGVAGSGMSGLAAPFIELGHAVGGADKGSTTETERVERLGPRVPGEQRPGDAGGAPPGFFFSPRLDKDNS